MKKIISLILVLSMVMAMAVSVSAEELSAAAQTEGITTSGGTDTSKVKLTIGDGEGGGSGSATFKVTVPTMLPFAVTTGSTGTPATNAKIINAGNAPVKVTGVKATGTNQWAIVANNTDFSKVAVNSKQFTLTLNGDNFPAADTGADSTLTMANGSWPSIDGNNGNLPLTYSGSFALQTSNIAAEIADVVFTVAWDA